MATKFTDGKNTVTISMSEGRRGNFGEVEWEPDFENDFYEVGGLETTDDGETYKVQDVGYLIEQAKDWQHATGDFDEDYENMEEDEDEFKSGEMVWIDNQCRRVIVWDEEDHRLDQPEIDERF